MKKTVVARIVALAFSALLIAGAASVGTGEVRTLAAGTGDIDWP
ncbi:hypothetical protein AB0N09_19650 [Streptomyces erythrochromogenes]